MAPISLEQENYRLRAQWNLNPGVPKSLTKKAGAGYMTVRRTLTKDLSGREEYHSPNEVSLPGGGASNVSDAIQTATGIAGVDWVLTDYQSYRGRAEWQWKALFQGRRGQNIYNPGTLIDRQMNGVVMRCENLQSAFIYGDGGGVLARIDPNAVLAIGQTTIPLLLPRTAINFESYLVNQKTGDKEGGDTLEFSSDKGTPGTALAGVRNYRPRVAGVRRVAGELVLDPGIPDDGGGNPLLQPGDYIFIAGQYGRMLIGHGAWCPSDGSSAFLSTPFYGVNRDAAPEKLAGLRVQIGTGEDPYNKLTSICEQLMVNSAMVDRLFTTPEEWQSIQNSAEMLARRLGAKIVMGRGQNAPVTMEVSDTLQRDSKRNITGGSITYNFDFPSALVVPGPQGRPIYIMPDEYLYDIDAGPKGQSVYRGWNSADWKLHGTVDGSYVWVNLDGNGPLYQSTDKEIVSANYSVEGIYVHEATINSVVASPNVINT